MIPRVGIALGALAAAALGLWCLVGGGIYGSPIASAGGTELLQFGILFLLGPLSILPASLLALRFPKEAGLWLLSGAVAFMLWAVFVIGFTGLPYFPQGLGRCLGICAPVVVPMGVLGILFLKSDTARGSFGSRAAALSLPLLIAVPVSAWMWGESRPWTTLVVSNRSNQRILDVSVQAGDASSRFTLIPAGGEQRVELRSRAAGPVRIEGMLQDRTPIAGQFKSMSDGSHPRVTITFIVGERGRLSLTSDSGQLR